MRLRALLLASLIVSPAWAERRAALLVGENAGDDSDTPLVYAESDAAAMREVLVRIGGVPDADTTLLRGAKAEDLRVALSKVNDRFAREGWGKEDRLIVYVSAHASEGELHLRGSRFPLSELRNFIDQSRAGVALLILDTCESGQALRAKGLLPLSSPQVRVERPSLTGRVIIAASGPKEPAFESDQLGGSLFTQHFIAGLSGAADTSHDGRVSLQEAYAYAYARTVDSAAALHEGKQTPSFDIDLRGEGELVLSEPSSSRARLKLDLDRPGDWVITSIDGSAQVARFVKPAGTALFALNPGDYRLRTRVEDHYEEETLHVVDGEQVTITEAELTKWKLVPAGRKGIGPTDRLVAQGVMSSGAVSGLGTLGGFGFELRHGLDSSYLVGRPILVATASEIFGNPENRAFYEQETAIVVGGGFEARTGPILLRAVGAVGAIGLHQHGGPGGNIFAIEPRLNGELGAGWTFAGDWSLDLSVSGGGLWVRTNLGRNVQPFIATQGGIGLGW